MTCIGGLWNVIIVSTNQNPEEDGVKKWKWPIAWLVQIAEMLAIGALAALTDIVHPVLYGVMVWAVMPVLGLFSACRTTRRGLLNYAAWIAPPVCMWLSYRLIWGYSLTPGPVIVCAFLSLVGAAAGEVLNRQNKG